MADVTGRDEITQVRRLAQLALVAAVVSAAVALLIALGFIRVAGILSTEEPPIRVRNGSQDVVAAYTTWDKDTEGNNKNWHLKNGTYNHKHLKLKFYYQGATCKGNYASVDKLTVEYVDGSSTNSVRITQPGHKISVQSDNDLARNSAGDIVSFGSADKGFISKVFLDNDSVAFCTFTSDQELGAIEVADW